jgi:hypothetical protein
MAAGLLLVGTAAAAGQQPPPIQGVTGTVALEGTARESARAAHTVIAKTVNGVEHLFHVTERAVVHFFERVR